MISQIIKDKQMSFLFETGFIPFLISTGRKMLYASSMQIVWQEVEGELDGVIKLKVSNIVSSESTIQTVNLNSATNEANSLTIQLFPIFEFLRLKYEPNGITAGILNAYIFYRELR